MYTRTLAILQSIHARNVTGRGMSYVCNRCSGWVHSSVLVFKTQQSTDELRTGYAALAVLHPLYQNHNRYQHQFQHKLSMEAFTIMQFNANGIGNKLTEFLKWHNVKVAVIEESKLSPNSKTSNIQNFTTVRKDRRQDQGGGLLTLIHKSINFSRKPESPETLVKPYLEKLTITATL